MFDPSIHNSSLLEKEPSTNDCKLIKSMLVRYARNGVGYENNEFLCCTALIFSKYFKKVKVTCMQ